MYFFSQSNPPVPGKCHGVLMKAERKETYVAHHSVSILVSISFYTFFMSFYGFIGFYRFLAHHAWDHDPTKRTFPKNSSQSFQLLRTLLTVILSCHVSCLLDLGMLRSSQLDEQLGNQAANSLRVCRKKNSRTHGLFVLQ